MNIHDKMETEIENLAKDTVKKSEETIGKLPSLVKNRRFKKLTELIDEGEYFSEESIKFREPLLYFLYIGRYKRDGIPDLANIQLSQMLNDQIMSSEYDRVLKEAWSLRFGKELEEADFREKVLSLTEQEDNEDELLSLMHGRFLAGLDWKFIDYTTIDQNEDLDDLKLQNQDSEDHFFASEPVEQQQPVSENETGIQDF